MSNSFNTHRARALTLMSGGLDSQLAACLLRQQGIEVVGLAFTSPFFNSRKAEQAAAYLQLPLITEDFTAAILTLLEKPPHGFGAGMNPCIDCHAAMLRQAGCIMRARGFDFISTGEVLNQRPMSQNRQALQIVARESGLADVLVRPLSAQLLPITRPETENLVDRTRLLALEGRNRKPQIALAAQFGIANYPQPAGGCLLTEKLYSLKLRELREHEGLGDLACIQRLSIGRHFRLPAGGRADALQDGPRLIIGRNQEENRQLEAGAHPAEIVIRPADAPGATAVLAAGADEGEIAMAAAICARYTDQTPGRPARMMIRSPAGPPSILETAPAPQDEIERRRIG